MTKDEFIDMCREQDSAAVDQLQKMGLEPFPCSCDYWFCKGWVWYPQSLGEVVLAEPIGPRPQAEPPG